MALLEIKDLVVEYGIIRAIKGIDMKVEEGQIVAILGANGAGKSSTIRTISGLVKAREGEINFKGENIANMLPHLISTKGAIQSPEGRLIFNGLTVEENLQVGAYGIKKQVIVENGVERVVKPKERIRKLMKDVYNYFPILEERKKQQASTLSGGEQQMLAIGRALMGDPELLLLDEPSLGLAPMIVKDIFEIIEKIRSEGKTILIVEQNAFQTLRISDYAYVLELGKVKFEGTGEELLKNDELVNAYLGK